MNVQECQCRWCKRPVELTDEEENYRDLLNCRVDCLGYESLTEDEQALVLCGPLCDDCMKVAG